MSSVERIIFTGRKGSYTKVPGHKMGSSHMSFTDNGDTCGSKEGSAGELTEAKVIVPFGVEHNFTDNGFCLLSVNHYRVKPRGYILYSHRAD